MRDLDAGSPLVLVGVDVETDVGSFVPFYEGVRTGVPRLLDLFASRGIAATFFFTGEAARRFPETAREVARAHEVGWHSLYHETLRDELFPIPNARAVSCSTPRRGPSSRVRSSARGARLEMSA